MDQKRIFLSEEGDNCFQHNKPVLNVGNINNDPVFALIKKYQLTPKKVLEMGCANGFRLVAVHETFKSEVFDIEPSRQVIEDENKLFPMVNIEVGASDDLIRYQNTSFDLIIINFVLHWIDRNLLLKTVVELDRMLKDDGFLIIGDFFPVFPTQNGYHHLDEVLIYTYKQDYEKIFLVSNLYQLVEKNSLSHESKQFTTSSDYYDCYFIALLKKKLVKLYHHG